MKQENRMIGTIIGGNLWADTGAHGGELVFSEGSGTMTAKQVAGLMGLRLVSAEQFDKECAK